MHLIQSVERSLRWQAALLGLACLAFSSGAWAQERGFFVYPGTEPTKWTSITVAAIECENFNAKANKEIPLKCKFIPTQPKKDFYALNQPPAVLLFSKVNPFCYWDPMRQVWVCI